MKIEKGTIVYLLKDGNLLTPTIKEIHPRGEIKIDEANYRFAPLAYDPDLKTFIEKQAGIKPEGDNQFLIIWRNKFRWMQKVGGDGKDEFVFNGVHTPFHSSAVWTGVDQAYDALKHLEIDKPAPDPALAKKKSDALKKVKDIKKGESEKADKKSD